MSIYNIMGISNETLTDAWTVKPLYSFNGLRVLSNSAIANAKRFQTYQQVCNAYIMLEEYLMAICLRRDMLNDEKKELNEIEECLYGDVRKISTVNLWKKYNITITINDFGEKKIKNALNIINMLRKIFQEVTEVAYLNNLIIPQPLEKKVATERLEETFMS